MKILVVRYGTIGDCIFASAFYRELRKNYPDAQIDALVDKVSMGVMEHCPYIDNLVYVPRVRRKYLDFFYYYPILRQYDKVYFPKNDATFTLFSYIAGIKERIGFHLARNKHLTLSVSYTETKHERDYYLDLLRAQDLEITSDKLEIWRDEEAKPKIKDILDKTLQQGQRSVLIQAFSRFTAKNWLNAYWAELIRYLSDELDMQVYFSGGKKDTRHYRQIYKLLDKSGGLKYRPVDMSGKLTISETTELINNMDLVISVDSCSIHIAAGLNIPSVLIHGSTSLLRWLPLSKKCVIASKNYWCSPCALQSGTKKFCKRKVPKCMKNLLPCDVISMLPIKKEEKIPVSL